MTSLQEDPRWRRFNDRGFACPCCGRRFQGVFDIAFDHPDVWPHGNRGASGEDQLVAGSDRLSSDLCMIDDQRFVRCIFPVPIRGADEKFAFGVWASVSRDNFDAYVDAWNRDDYADFEGCFAWLANHLPAMDVSGHLRCNLVIEDPAKRPALYVQSNVEGDDRRVLAHQRDGISFDRLLDIYAATGQDIRPHLTDG